RPPRSGISLRALKEIVRSVTPGWVSTIRRLRNSSGAPLNGSGRKSIVAPSGTLPASTASNGAVTNPWLTTFTANSAGVPHGTGGGNVPARVALTRASGLIVIPMGGSPGEAADTPLIG